LPVLFKEYYFITLKLISSDTKQTKRQMEYRPGMGRPYGHSAMKGGEFHSNSRSESNPKIKVDVFPIEFRKQIDTTIF